jgi:hypothetical protein
MEDSPYHNTAWLPAQASLGPRDAESAAAEEKSTTSRSRQRAEEKTEVERKTDLVRHAALEQLMEHEAKLDSNIQGSLQRVVDRLMDSIPAGGSAAAVDASAQTPKQRKRKALEEKMKILQMSSSKSAKLKLDNLMEKAIEDGLFDSSDEEVQESAHGDDEE